MDKEFKLGLVMRPYCMRRKRLQMKTKEEEHWLSLPTKKRRLSSVIAELSSSMLSNGKLITLELK